jgi:hypothetical protein
MNKKQRNAVQATSEADRVLAGLRDGDPHCEEVARAMLVVAANLCNREKLIRILAAIVPLIEEDARKP